MKQRNYTTAKHLVGLTVAVCLLMVFCGDRLAGLALAQSSVTKPEVDPGLKLEFTTQVYQRKTKQQVDSLRVNDFRLSEDGREQTIISVERETRPLSVVAIPIFGVDDLGTVTGNMNMDTYGMMLESGLKAGDNLAIVLPDKEGQIIREFGQSPDTIPADFAKVARISKDSLTPGWAWRASTRSSYRILISPINYYNIALQKAVSYLNQHRKPGIRSAILFMDFPNGKLELVSEDMRKQLTDNVLREDIVVSWLSHPGSTLRDAEYLLKLPELTGGEILKESVFRQIYIWQKKRDALDALNETTLLLERLRTRYRISYVSTNPKRDGQMRKLKLELAPQWQKVKDKPVVRAPQAIIAPGP